MNYLHLILFSYTVLFFQSCDKHRAKKLSGNYTCQIERTCFGGCNTPDSSYTEIFKVESEGKDLILFNSKIHIDNFKYGVEYRPNYNFSVTFEKDRLDMLLKTGGMGCSCEYVYSCEKED